MGDYWGATADPRTGFSPYSGQLHYGQHAYSDEPFTSKPGDGTTGMTIEEIQMRIHNMHPEQIAALADQWQNAWTLMQQFHDFVFRQSTVLNDDTWKSPKARDAFMQKGPGQALSYLDLWMDAAMSNVVALRGLVSVAEQARSDIDEVVRKYQQALQDAQNVDGWDEFGAWVTGLTVTPEEAKQNVIHDQVTAAQKHWTIEAQKVAYQVGTYYYDYTGSLSAGMGPPVQPMNAVLNAPGHAPIPNLPGGLPGATAAAPPPVAPPPAAAPALPPPAPAPAPAGPPPEPGQVAPPPAEQPAPAPDPSLAPAVPSAAAPPPAPGVLPSSPPLAPGVLPPPPPLAPSLAPRFSGSPPAAPPASLPGGSPNALASAPPAGARQPGQLTRSAFGRSAPPTPEGTQNPGRTLRNPNARGATPEEPGNARGLAGRRPGSPGFEEEGRSGARQPGAPGARRPGARGFPEEGRPGARRPGSAGFEDANRSGTRRPGSPEFEEGRPGVRRPGSAGFEDGNRSGTRRPGSPEFEEGRPGARRPGSAGFEDANRSGTRRPGSPEFEDGRPGVRRPGQPGFDERGGRPGAGRPGSPGFEEGGRRAGRAGPPGSPPGRPDRDRREGAQEHAPGAPLAGEEAFAPPEADIAPPVLSGPARYRPEPVQHLRGTHAARPDGTSPQVLNSPGRPVAPAAPERPGTRTSKQAQPQPATAADDWIGAAEARSGASASVLDAPGAPPSGARVSRLEEVPDGLRSRAATRAPGERTRPGSTPPELTKRRTDRKAAEQPGPERDDEAATVVSDEAFEVETPGGGVVTSQRDAPAYEPEHPRAFGSQ